MRECSWDFLPESHHARLLVLRQAADEGVRQGRAAELAGMTPQTLASWLGWLLGSGKWPPPREQIDALLALPVVTDHEARSRYQRILAADRADTRCAIRGDERPSQRLSESFIVQSRQQTDAARAAHERYWLEQEQAKYNLPRLGRPLSSMPA